MTRAEIARRLGWHPGLYELSDLLDRIEAIVVSAVAQERAKHVRPPDDVERELERLRGIARASGRAV